MPSSFGLWFGAYAESLADDMHLLAAAWQLVNKSPLGSAAGYGSSLPLDREMTAHLLGYTDVDGRGIAGVERAFDRELNFAEEDVRLTVDLRIQHILHRELEKAKETFQAIADLMGGDPKHLLGAVAEGSEARISAWVSVAEERAGESRDRCRIGFHACVFGHRAVTSCASAPSAAIARSRAVMTAEAKLKPSGCTSSLMIQLANGKNDIRGSVCFGAECGMRLAARSGERQVRISRKLAP
jgi:hypothetical protein